MTNTKEVNYICTPYFCRRNVLGFYPIGDFAENPIIIPADRFDFFAVVMADTLDGYTMFDDRIISFDAWTGFLYTASEYLSLESYDELLEIANERLVNWLKINGKFFWSEIDSYCSILSLLLSWTAENVSEDGVWVKGI